VHINEWAASGLILLVLASGFLRPKKDEGPGNSSPAPSP
jgi:hypothetical protein